MLIPQPLDSLLLLFRNLQDRRERAMTVRMLAYTALLHQKPIGEGVLREHDALPPVLPIVICNGRRGWSAAADVSDPIASGGAALHAEREGPAACLQVR